MKRPHFEIFVDNDVAARAAKEAKPKREPPIRDISNRCGIRVLRMPIRALAALLLLCLALTRAAGTCGNQPKDWLGIVAEVGGLGLLDACHLDILSTKGNNAGFALVMNASSLRAWSVRGGRTFGAVSLALTPAGRCVVRDIEAPPRTPQLPS
jgi:hypothetical protein